MKTLSSYTFEELAQGNAGVMIQVNKDTCLTIQIVDGKALVLFPFGNDLASPEMVGHLSKGVLVLNKSLDVAALKGTE